MANPLVLILFVLIGNPFIFILIITRMGYPARTSFLTSVTVAQNSEFSFIVAGLGMASGLIGPEILSIVALVGVATIAVSAYMILYNHGLFAFCERFGLLRWRIFRTSGKADQAKSADHHIRHSQHVIVVGMNTLGRDIVHRLCQRGETVVAIDTDPMKLEGLPCRTLHGSVEYLTVLEEVGYDRAKLLISALSIEHVNDILAHRSSSAHLPVASYFPPSLSAASPSAMSPPPDLKSSRSPPSSR